MAGHSAKPGSVETVEARRSTTAATEQRPPPLAPPPPDSAASPVFFRYPDRAARDEAEAPRRIVALGASAGGLDAIERFFENVPPDTGMAFVIVQHLSPDHKSLMPELLARYTTMPIALAADRLPLAANHVYLNTPRRTLTVERGHFRLAKAKPSMSLHLPIDAMFESLARNATDHAVAVVLSGTGSDGTRGVRAVKEHGGIVMIQDHTTARFDGMPRSAEATGLGDFIATPQDMPGQLLRYIEHPYSQPEQRGQLEHESTKLEHIVRLIRKRHDTDFSVYKTGTLARRIERRMGINHIVELDDYVTMLDESPYESQALANDLLIGVTQFFRDPKVWESLRKRVLPDLIRALPDDQPLRLWAPACSTGEEAYTLAIIARETLDELGDRRPLKVFASDVDQRAIDLASKGVYSESIAADVSPQRLQHFFVRSDGLYHAKRRLRESIIFTRHNVVKDPPFTKLHLISCRNLLIYLRPATQRQLLSLFHFALRRDGVLQLGQSETATELGEAYTALSEKWRVYRKNANVAVAQLQPLRSSEISQRLHAASEAAGHSATRPAEVPFAREAADFIVNQVGPPAVLLNARFELLRTFGDAQRFVHLPSGRFSKQVLEMIDGPLRGTLSTALHQCRQSRKPVVYADLTTTDAAAPHERVQLEVQPFVDEGGDIAAYLVLLRPSATPGAAPANDLNHDQQARIQTLETELQHSRESLRYTVEEVESSNEQLQSTNEEMLAANEELQSTNEELQSVNEELYTVNAELQSKVSQLEQVTADFENLLRSSDLGVIFLDRDMAIRKFTAAATEYVNLAEHDLGRRLDDLTHNIADDNVVADIRSVIAGSAPITKEVHDRRGRSLLLRIHPFQTHEQFADGAVIIFVDTTVIEEAQHALRQANRALKRRNEEMEQFTSIASHDLQEPLRTIKGFSQLLREHLDTVLDDEARDFLGRIEGGITRLQTLIQDLLRLSRVSSSALELQPVAVSTVVEQVLADLAQVVRQADARVHYENLPTVLANEALLGQLIQNLIENAIKYRSDAPPEITLTAKHATAGWQINVRDNGMGINPAFHERIFEVFRRLHASDKHRGTGIGLAIARKIVERHGGHIWVSSQPGEGATFHFTLSAVQE